MCEVSELTVAKCEVSEPTPTMCEVSEFTLGKCEVVNSPHSQKHPPNRSYSAHSAAQWLEAHSWFEHSFEFRSFWLQDLWPRKMLTKERGSVAKSLKQSFWVRMGRSFPFPELKDITSDKGDSFPSRKTSLPLDILLRRQNSKLLPSQMM